MLSAAFRSAASLSICSPALSRVAIDELERVSGVSAAPPLLWLDCREAEELDSSGRAFISPLIDPAGGKGKGSTRLVLGLLLSIAGKLYN